LKSPFGFELTGIRIDAISPSGRPRLRRVGFQKASGIPGDALSAFMP